MADLLFTLHCADRDAESLVEAIRAVTGTPIQIRGETVRGRDYGDAGIAEQVSGRLRRSVLELVIGADLLPDLLRAVTASRHALPVRWRSVAILDHGRIA